MATLRLSYNRGTIEQGTEEGRIECRGLRNEIRQRPIAKDLCVLCG
jgi:hypothetical protein